MLGCAFWYAGRKSLKKTAFRPALSAQRSVSDSVGNLAQVVGNVSPAPAALAAWGALVGATGGALVGWLADGAGADGDGALVQAASAAAPTTAPLPITNWRRFITRAEDPCMVTSPRRAAQCKLHLQT